MFYCDPCRVYNDWPESLSTSRGNCEMCHKQAVCYDVPSKFLPPSRAYREWEAKKLLALKVYDPKVLDTDIFGDVE